MGKSKLILSSLLFVSGLMGCQQKTNSLIPDEFVREYYEAYSGVPKAAKLERFYADSIVLDDPTYDWVGSTKQSIFANFDSANLNNEYEWHVNQQILQDNKLVVEGLLKAKYAGIPYEMRFVNIFQFAEGKIVRQFDYYDNKEWYNVVDQWNKGKKAKQG